MPGYFSANPGLDPQADHLPRITYEEALGMANAGCEVVQGRAIEAARAAGVRLIVRGLDDTAGSIVSENSDEATLPVYGDEGVV